MSSNESPQLPKAPDPQRVVGLLGELEDRLSQLKNWQRESGEHFEQIQQQAQELDHRRNNLEQRSEKLHRLQEQVTDARSQLGQQSTDLEQQQNDLVSRRQKIAFQQEALEEQSRRLQTESEQFEQLKRTLTEQQKQIESSRERLDTEQAKLAEQREQFAGRQKDLEQTRHSLANLEQELTDRENELAGRAQELDAKLGRIEHEHQEQTRQQEQFQQQAARHAEQQEQIEQARQELARQVTTGGEEMPEPSEDLAQLQEREEQLDRLREQLEQREATLETKLANYRQKLEQSKLLLLAEREHLRQKEKAIDKRAASGQTGGEETGKEQGRNDARRTKLHKYKTLLKQRSKTLRDADRRSRSSKLAVSGLKQQRQMLVEVKNFLESSEAEMVRRWATNKASALVVGTILCLSLLALISYFVGQNAIQPVHRAAMTMVIKTSNDRPLRPVKFVARHRSLLMADAVLNETISQLAQRGTRPFNQAKQLLTHLSLNLKVSSPGSGRLELSYLDTDGQLAQAMLESLGRAYLSYQASQNRIEGTESLSRIVQPAALAPKPVEDLRLIVSAAVFGGMVLLGLIFGLIMRWWLMRSQRVFDSDPAMAMTDLENPVEWTDAPDNQGPPFEKPDQ